MPARRPGRKRHDLEPQTGLHHRRGRSPSAAGSLRSTERAGLGHTGRNAGIIRSPTAASQPARASRALAPGRRPTSNSPNAFIRPQRLRRSRQIPIGQNLRSSSRGFVPWRLSDAGPGASGCACDGRHPKPFTSTDVSWFTSSFRGMPRWYGPLCVTGSLLHGSIRQASLEHEIR